MSDLARECAEKLCREVYGPYVEAMNADERDLSRRKLEPIIRAYGEAVAARNAPRVDRAFHEETANKIRDTFDLMPTSQDIALYLESRYSSQAEAVAGPLREQKK